jgi:SAM-dependent methyltransferase
MPKREGFAVKVVDFLDTDALRRKYGTDQHPNIDPGAIEPVDFVSRSEPLVDLVGADGPYDWIVASHVVEHIPDLVSFFQDVERVLAPNGRLALVIPDRRYTFDHLGELTTTGQVLDAFLERRTGPTPGQAFDHYARFVTLGGSIAWSAAGEGALEPFHPYEAARDAYARALAGDDFDGELHCWRFTPESFRLLVDDLGDLGLTTLGVAAEHEPVGCEFFVTLARGAASPRDDRFELLRAIRRAG